MREEIITDPKQFRAALSHAEFLAKIELAYFCIFG